MDTANRAQQSPILEKDVQVNLLGSTNASTRVTAQNSQSNQDVNQHFQANITRD